jgi:RNA polymerase sigma-B factor
MAVARQVQARGGCVAVSESRSLVRERLQAYHEHGDRKARDELVAELMPLVRALARRYAGRGEQLDDLIQVGAIGLIKAIDRYDPSRGAELTTYAIPTIVGEIKRHFRDKGWSVHVPRGLKELNLRLSRRIESLTASLGRSPTIAELAVAEDVSEEEVVEALETGMAYAAQSLSAPVLAADEPSDLQTISAIASVDPGFETTEDRVVLAAGLRALDERERRILMLRFFDGLTQSQIAAEVGISQMHVSRLIRKALETMRSEIETG